MVRDVLDVLSSLQKFSASWSAAVGRTNAQPFDGFFCIVPLLGKGVVLHFTAEPSSGGDPLRSVGPQRFYCCGCVVRHSRGSTIPIVVDVLCAFPVLGFHHPGLEGSNRASISSRHALFGHRSSFRLVPPSVQVPLLLGDLRHGLGGLVIE